MNFLVESFGLLNDFFPLPSILDAGYPVFYLYLADVYHIIYQKKKKGNLLNAIRVWKLK
jgi:hypothetical protein